jgi:3-phosphoshikimate 1-carboxyvinyltransferase
MIKTISPQQFNKEITAPASKSYMQRAIAIALLSKGKTILTNPTYCNDSLFALEAIKNLGAEVTKDDDFVEITGGFKPISNHISVGESGLGMRMFTPIASLSDQCLVIDGEGSLKKRPTLVEDALVQLGVKCNTNNGFLPLEIQGPLVGGFAVIDGSASSQFLTGLLIALPFACDSTRLVVKNLKSKPYIDITIEILNEFGIKVEHKNYEEFSIKGNQTSVGKTYFVEGDWSGASFLLVAGAIAGSVKVKGLNANSVQADRAIMEVIEKVGAEIITSNDYIQVSKKELNSFEFDATDCPDLFPPLVSLAAYCNGISRIKGISRLEHKESNRADVLHREFAKLNVKIELVDDFMLVHGGEVSGGTIHSNNDHRIAMAGAVAALSAKDAITIENAESINKSYSNFYEDLLL